MLQVRKLVLAVAAATAFTSGFANALGLGELAVKSSLNQPLEAEISLLEVRDLTSADIKTQLASSEDFTKAGVDRQFFLTGLTFTPMIGANGKSVIRVTSNKPVKEPYLNFLVEVLWPNGRLLREYTLLLDPPLYKAQQVTYSGQPAATAGSTQAQLTGKQVQPSANQAAGRRPAATQAARKTEYRVKKNDTLWKIAIDTKEGSSVQQAMLAIQDRNPDAFLGGNINRLHSGHLLRLPTLDEVNSRTFSQAAAEVAEQNASWKNKRTATLAKRQLDATERTQAGAAPQQIEQTDSLRLVAETPGESKQASDSGKSDEYQNLQDQLASSKERLDSALLENEDLKERVDELDSQLAKLQRLMTLKDNLLAQLQDAAGDTELANQVESSNEALNAEMDSAGLVDELEGQSEPVAATAEELAADTQSDSDVDAETEVAAEDGEASPAASTEKAADKATDSQAEDKSVVDQAMGNPMLLAAAGGAAVLALLLALMGLSRRNARKQAESYDEPLTDGFTPDYVADVKTAEQDDIFLAEPGAAFAGDSNKAGLAPQFKQEVSDPMVEANGYIGFARFTQAAEVLHNAIDQEPQRLDLQLKLLEVYAELEDQSAFLTQIAQLEDIGAEQADIAAITARYPHLLMVENDANTYESNSTNIDLSDAEPAVDDDLDAELDQLSAQLADSTPVAGTADTEFDLQFELNEQADDVTPAKPSVSDDDFSFDDITLDLDTTQPQDTAEFALSDEFDFSGLELDETELTKPVITDEDFSDFDLESIDLTTPVESSTDSVDETVLLDDLDFVPYSDNTTVKLNLARTYIDQGDAQGAREILDEVVAQGTPEQQQEARQLLGQLV